MLSARYIGVLLHARVQEDEALVFWHRHVRRGPELKVTGRASRVCRGGSVRRCHMYDGAYGGRRQNDRQQVAWRDRSTMSQAAMSTTSSSSCAAACGEVAFWKIQRGAVGRRGKVVCGKAVSAVEGGSRVGPGTIGLMAPQRGMYGRAEDGMTPDWAGEAC
ncbi:hypothetical protein CERSUDRAFT_72874 [Gelatoporia subvermispora B]|uniref:Uncharacterized protein n=1 Tax=Ceriporiopsis subvermispora (strain B) TaxID=914234 RepID=M2R1E9_CERS8|nr:hypothetical protein CERSUDRAFT_72874 [Gelatoporia subvermispora B]